MFRDLKSLHQLIDDYCKGVETVIRPKKFKIEKQNSNNDCPVDNVDVVLLDGKNIKPQSIKKARSFQTKKTLKMNSFIIQKYIEKPLLVHKRKFDIRVWVLVNHTGKCYFFKEGYLRTSGSDFEMDDNNPDDQYVHLTNNAVQKNAKNYGEFEEGNQLSFSQFQEYIDTHYADRKINFFTDCLPKMKEMVVHSLIAARK